MSILQIQSISKQFDKYKALDHVSFEVEKGALFGLLGPNGAGKTTLIRMITGILVPDEGKVILDGKEVVALNNSRSIGYMPEERGLYKKMKVGEQAIYLAMIKGLDKKEATQKVRFWFDKLDMNSWWNKKVEDLSKGMAQKLQFVCTIAHDPSLIILDEPFSGLDPMNADIIKTEIYELAKKGATILFSTHRMEQVEEICDHIVLINKGQKILDGRVLEAKKKFQKNEFIIEGHHLDRIVSNELYDVIDSSPHKVTIKAKDTISSNQLLQTLASLDIQIALFKENLPSLNEIFIDLVQK